MLLHDMSDIPLDLLRLGMALEWNSLQVSPSYLISHDALIQRLCTDSIFHRCFVELDVLETVDIAQRGVANHPI